jgi:hypothetical protein
VGIPTVSLMAVIVPTSAARILPATQSGFGLWRTG